MLRPYEVYFLQNKVTDGSFSQRHLPRWTPESSYETGQTIRNIVNSRVKLSSDHK